MNRGSLAEDPKGGLSPMSRYSRMGGEANSLLYVDSSSARKARKAAEKAARKAGEAVVKGNHNPKQKKSVGHRLSDSHMDRLEVGSDGRLFHVHDNSAENPLNNKKTESAAGLTAARRVKPARPYLDPEYRNPLLIAAGSKSGNSSPRISAAGQAAGRDKGSRNPLLSAAGREPGNSNPLLSAAGRKPENSNPLLITAGSRGRVSLLSGSLMTGVRAKVAAAVLAAAAAGYIFAAWHFSSRFYPGTSFFGIGVYNMSVADAKAAVQAKVDTYELELETRNPAGDSDDGNAGNIITASDVSLTYDDDGAIDRAMKSQRSWAWPVMMIVNALTGHSQEIQTSYSESEVPDVVEGLACFREDRIIEPEDARIELTDDGAVVVPEIYGTKLDAGKTEQAVMDALDRGETTIDLDELGLYINPDVYSADVSLTAQAQALNMVLGAKITLDMGSSEEIINSEVISTFLTENGGEYHVDENAVYAYVEKLAEKYDTYQTARTFYTSIGTTVELEEGVGDYGWQMDQEATAREILSAIDGKETVETEPVYSVEGFCHDANDIGDTYVEINLTTQTMWFYKDGELVVKTPVVTGNPYAGNATPSGGVWSLKERARNRLLSGEGYTSPVDYWLPFNHGVGIHDMQTRAWFGGNIYLGSGSHGCINTPLAAVKLIYNSIEVGTPVVVYEDESETASSLITGPYDSVSLTAQIEETYGTVDDDGAGSIVYWTKQQKAAAAQSASATAASSAQTSGSTAS